MQKTTDIASEQLLGTIESIYGDLGLVDRWKGILRSICRLINADGGFLSTPWLLPDTEKGIDHQTGQVLAAYSACSQNFPIRRYSEHFHRLDPLAIEIARHRKYRSGFVARFDEFIDTATFEASEFYNDWLKKIGTPTILFICLSGTDDRQVPIAHMTFYRSRNRDIFDETNSKTLRLLAPHLQQSFRLEHSIRQEAEIAKVVDQAKGRGRRGVAVVDVNGRVLHINDLLGKILDENDSLIYRNGYIRAMDSKVNCRLQNAVKTCASRNRMIDPGEIGSVAVRSATEDKVIIVQVTPLTTSCGLTNGPRAATSPRAVLQFFVEHAGTPPTFHANIQGAFGLTRSEVRFAEAFMEYTSVAMAAHACGITVGSARNVLKSIYRKTDTVGQAALVKLMMQYA